MFEDNKVLQKAVFDIIPGITFKCINYYGGRRPDLIVYRFNDDDVELFHSFKYANRFKNLSVLGTSITVEDFGKLQIDMINDEKQKLAEKDCKEYIIN